MNTILASRKPLSLSRRNQSAFTIIELIIVIVIIAVLATISFLVFNNVQQRATNSSIASKESQAKKKLETYKIDNGSYPPDQSTFDTLVGQTTTDSLYTTYTSTPPHDSYTLSTAGGSGNPANTVALPWSSNGYNGLINYLGTNGSTVAFTNPHPSKLTVSQSTNYVSNAGLAHLAVNQSIANNNDSHTSGVDNSWWKLDLGAGKSIKLERFGILGRSVYTAGMGHHPRNFKIQGSNNDTDWNDLITTTGAGPDLGTWWSSAVSTTVSYRYVRILQTGPNSYNRNFLVLGDVEVWGVYSQ